MRRREFIAGVGAAATWPLTARAQQSDKMRLIGVLLAGEEGDTAYFIVSGSVEPSHLAIRRRAASNRSVASTASG